MTLPPPFQNVVPAPGCPHYISADSAERGRITCTGCEERAVVQMIRRRRRGTAPVLRIRECTTPDAA